MSVWNWVLVGLFLWVSVIPLVAVKISQVLHRRAMELPVICRCGHLSEVHRHYRPGEDCGVYGCDCTKLVPRG